MKATPALTLLLLLPGCFLLPASPTCLDAGVDGGCVLWSQGPGNCGVGCGGTNPSGTHNWDLYFDDFASDVTVTNLSFSDGLCTMAGGPVHSSFSADPASVGTRVGSLSWSPTSTPGGRLFVEVGVQSSATIGGQSGQSSPNNPLTCDGSAEAFTGRSYRMTSEFTSLSGSIDATAPMPIDPYTGGNIGCPPLGSSCHLQYWFDNSLGLVRSAPFSLDQLFSGQSFTISFAGTAENTPNPSQTRSGHYDWSGTLKLHAVQTE